MRDTREERPADPAGDGTPKFGRLLIVLAMALLMVVALTLGSEAYFT